LWPIRRRSIAALTVSRHIEFDEDGANLRLYPADTKSKRSESIRVLDPLVPYLKRYLNEFRPRLLGPREHDGFWASCKHGPLSGVRIYDIVRARTKRKFGKAMCLHDFRRSAATFLAMDAPEMIGVIPGVLQQASQDVSDQHYNLARSTAASRRYSDALSMMRSKLRPLITKTMS
jgi:integrase